MRKGQVEFSLYSTIFFSWKNNNLTLHNRTYTEAYKIAESFGYEKPKWWKSPLGITPYILWSEYAKRASRIQQA